MKIREAISTDWEAIQELNNQVYLHDEDHDEDLDMERPFSEGGILYYKQLANGKYGHCFIAEIEGKAVGYIVLALKDIEYRTGKHVEIENMGVDSKHRSMGIGGELIKKGREWAESIDATKLYVSAYWENKSAINFYKKEGFSQIDIGLELSI